jgi:hypothetical protein
MDGSKVEFIAIRLKALMGRYLDIRIPVRILVLADVASIKVPELQIRVLDSSYSHKCFKEEAVNMTSLRFMSQHYRF